MEDEIKDKMKSISSDLVKIKNDLNIVKASTQISANLLSIIHGDNITDIVFSIANNEKLCKTLIVCSEPKTATQLCETLEIKPSNIRKQIIDKLLKASFLTVIDKQGHSELYQRAMFLDMIRFDQAAMSKYPSLRSK